eukprot:TRINITY_DN1875_c1_g2_i2.p1 TRINITY_DN1875_c1_g2~~TRINITY_DN1875_c1_g2_i2.p1  ORF type:complete len:162 (-),score=39.75 TRINITY_DN1875_c1_g2_i2:256-741(-)
MYNYNTLMGFVTGLNMAAMSRLKATMSEIDTKLIQKFNKLENVMDPSSSFKNYRKALQHSISPAMPYLGVYLTDLIYIEDGNTDYINPKPPSDKVLINYHKRQMVYKVLQEILMYQQFSYSFPPLDPVYTLLHDFPYDGDKRLFNLSLLYEPRNTDPKLIP